MEERYSTDWWLWQMYRQVADFVHHPTLANEQRLRELLESYRHHDRRVQTETMPDRQHFG